MRMNPLSFGLYFYFGACPTSESVSKEMNPLVLKVFLMQVLRLGCIDP